MTIYSLEFFLFFLILLIPYYYLSNKGQQLLLSFASIFFIGTLSVSFMLFTLMFVLFNYFLGIILGRNRDKERRSKLTLAIGLVFNIGLLVYYKYFDFLIENFNVVLSVFKSNVSLPVLNVLIPIGISYYTFQGIGYILQVSRKVEKAETNLIHFINYMIFFPKFIAGPIERSKTFLPQLHERKVFNYDDVVIGFRMILWGAFKKVVIADRISLIINSVNGNLSETSGFVYTMVFLLQPMHLYFDFSGYTHIALGVGRLFGIRLMENFRRPFFARTVGEFWKRWHISLSSWCNDFIFNHIILKHLKWKKWASVYAVTITFLVIGIWHGPNWTYIAVGLLQGIAINYEFFTKKTRVKIGNKLPKPLNIGLSCLFTYLFICLTLVFFNSSTLKDAGIFLSHMFSSFSIKGIGIYGYSTYAYILAGGIIVMLIDFLEEFKGLSLFNDFTPLPSVVKWAVYFGFTYLIVFHGGPETTFIYMKF